MHLSDRHYQQLRDTVSFLFAHIPHDIISYLFQIEYIKSPQNREILERPSSFKDAVAKAESINQYLKVVGAQQEIEPAQVLEMWERERKGLEFTQDNLERICRVSLDRLDFQLQATCDWILAWLMTVRVKPHHQPEDLPILLSQMLLDANRKHSESEEPLWRAQPAREQTDARSLFGIAEDATLEDVHSTYRNLCKQYHPDRGGSAEDFIHLQESYDILIAAMS